MRVLIFDDSFTGWFGHNAAYNLAISNELAQRHIPCLIFANRSVASSNKLPANIYPTFRYFAAITKLRVRLLPSLFHPPLRLAVGNISHYQDLKEAVTPTGTLVTSSDVVVVSLHSPFTSFAYAMWINSLNRKGIYPKLLFIVHNNTLKVIRAELVALRAVTDIRRVFFAAQNESLRQLCEYKSSVKFFELPLPYAQNLSLSNSSPKVENHTPVVFSYLGEANLTKGFDVLVSAITQLPDLLRLGTIAFVIQCYTRDGGAISGTAHHQLAELAKEHPNLYVINEPLSPQEYENKVREADVVLNPHRASAFGFARSGTFSEAMASAKPVIAAKGTFMAQEIAHYDTGLVFEDGSSESLSQMIRCAVDQFTFLQKKSKAAQGKWLNIHNAQNFTDIFLQNIQSDF